MSDKVSSSPFLSSGVDEPIGSELPELPCGCGGGDQRNEEKKPQHRPGDVNQRPLFGKGEAAVKGDGDGQATGEVHRYVEGCESTVRIEAER